MPSIKPFLKSTVLLIFFSSPAFSATESVSCSSTDLGKAVINEVFGPAGAQTQQFIELKFLQTVTSNNWQLCYKTVALSKFCTNIPDQQYSENSFYVYELANNQRLPTTASEILLLDGLGEVIDGLLYCNTTSCTDVNGDAEIWNWSGVSSCTTTLTEHDPNNKDIARIPDGTGTLADNGSDPTKGESNDGGGGGGGDTAATSFNCVENGANGITGNLYTKTTAQSFSFDIVALQDASTIETSFASGADHTVTVELVNTNTGDGSCENYLALSPTVSQSLTITSSDSGTKASATMSSGTAYSSVKCRVTDATDNPSVIGCSTDSFSIRPTAFTITSNLTNTGSTGTPKAKAGDSFTLTATATTGYTGTPAINNSNLEAHAGAIQTGSISGSFSAASSGTGTATGTGFSYTEVGSLRFTAQGIYDDSFTSVDQSGDCTDDFSNTPVSGKVGCKFGNIATSNYFGRFTPDHFTLDNSSIAPACTSFSYMGQPFGFSYSLSARNAAGGITQNYDAGYVKTSAINFVAEQLDTQNNESPSSYDLNKDSTGTERLETPYKNEALIYDKADWTQGNYTVNNSSTRFLRDTALIDGSFEALDIGINLVEDDGIDFDTLDMNVVENNDNCITNPLINCTEKKLTTSLLSLRYGRLNINNAHGSELLDLPVSLTAQYWDGSHWVLNSDDQCSTVTLSLTDPVATDGLIPSELCAWDNGTPGNSGLGCSTAGTPTNKFSEPPTVTDGGNFNLNFKAPGIGNTGALDTTVNVNDYLKFNWKNSGDINPTARHSFGVYQGNSKQIYFREVY